MGIRLRLERTMHDCWDQFMGLPIIPSVLEYVSAFWTNWLDFYTC